MHFIYPCAILIFLEGAKEWKGRRKEIEPCITYPIYINFRSRVRSDEAVRTLWETERVPTQQWRLSALLQACCDRKPIRKGWYRSPLTVSRSYTCRSEVSKCIGRLVGYTEFGEVGWWATGSCTSKERTPEIQGNEGVGSRAVRRSEANTATRTDPPRNNTVQLWRLSVFVFLLCSC